MRIATRLAAELGEGDSIAVNGVCLTATEVREDAFTAEAMAETLRRSSLGALRAGAPVNLELALRAGDRLGGHVVQGHVDGTGTVARDPRRGDLAGAGDRGRAAPAALSRGEGIGGARRRQPDGQRAAASDGFAVSLIPETLQRTRLGEWWRWGAA